jgi:hypothetical protein|tara:strand:+ start:3570 stop:3734 length:165 start_codon:yes stop_codon:yes gene_type:complete
MHLLNQAGGPSTLTIAAVVVAILSSSWLFGALITILTKGKNPLVWRKKLNDGKE